MADDGGKEFSGLLLIVYIVWFFTGKPNVTIDYVAQMNRAARPVADDNLNAAPLYRKAAKSFEDSYDGFVKEHPDLLYLSYDKATGQQKQTLTEWIADNKDTLEMVSAGAAKPYYWPKYEGQEAISVIMPNLSKFRNLTRTFCWRAWLRAEQGLYKDGFEDLKTCYCLGRHLKGDKTLIEQLVGIAIEALTSRTLRQMLSKHKFDQQTLAALQEDREKLILQEDFAVSIKVEKFFIFDEIQRCFTDDRIGGGHLYLQRFVNIWPEFLTGSVEEDGLWPYAIFMGRYLFTHPNKQETRDTVNRLYDYFEEVAKKSPGRRLAEQIDVDEHIQQIAKNNLFLSGLVPALNRVSIIGYRNKADAEATLTLIVILRHKEKVGKFPESLDELVEAGLLKALPTDPFSDKPLVYRRTDDGFTLYSFGENLVDDGGKMFVNDKGRARVWTDEGDAVFWPVH